MGILNLTPDSFSDGGKFNTPEKALERVEVMEKEGADMIDIGAESTGPGSKPVSVKEEINRLFPTLEEIRSKTSLPLSLDTYKSEVAEKALSSNLVDMINDVGALRYDEHMASVVRQYDVPIILMYAKDNSPRTSIREQEYPDVIQELKKFFRERISYCERQGISKEKIIIDPGMGHFVSANPRYSFEIINRLSELRELDCPILIGMSRKSFLGGDLESRGHKEEALSIMAHLNGVSILRTHHVGGLNFPEK